jgi:hypothetical protein
MCGRLFEERQGECDAAASATFIDEFMYYLTKTSPRVTPRSICIESEAALSVSSSAWVLGEGQTSLDSYP